MKLLPRLLLILLAASALCAAGQVITGYQYQGGTNRWLWNEQNNNYRLATLQWIVKTNEIGNVGTHWDGVRDWPTRVEQVSSNLTATISGFTNEFLIEAHTNEVWQKQVVVTNRVNHLLFDGDGAWHCVSQTNWTETNWETLP